MSSSWQFGQRVFSQSPTNALAKFPGIHVPQACPLANLCCRISVSAQVFSGSVIF